MKITVILCDILLGILDGLLIAHGLQEGNGSIIVYIFYIVYSYIFMSLATYIALGD